MEQRRREQYNPDFKAEGHSNSIGHTRTHGGTERTLTQMIRYDGTIYAHEFCQITGIKPATLRMSRARGKGPPAKRISNNRVVISFRDAAAWLQSTGRYGAALRLAEWLDQRWREAEREHRCIDAPMVHWATHHTDYKHVCV